MALLSKSERIMISVLISSLALCACGYPARTDDFKKATAISRIMDSWVGHYQSELIANWGPPTEIVSNGRAGNILIYESLKGTWGDVKDRRIVGGAHYRTKPGQPGYTAKRVFYVDEQGIIESWKWSGL
jgi:hypothetical protein